ncbi:MAG: SPOR domain-containing protein, partial [Deltaproteobacteria bacterium]|nr:SPOR domain-containing protein [Deltaproteobacteria bacterium]
IIGVVLNGLKAEISPDYEYHDKYYYYYGSERKKTLTVWEKVLSLSGMDKKNVKDPPEKSSSAKKEKKRPQRVADGKSGARSGVLRIGLLLLALGLLIAGLYCPEMIGKFVHVLEKPDDVIVKPPSAKVQTAPIHALPPNTAVDPGAAVSYSQQGASVMVGGKNAEEREAAITMAQDTPNLPYTIQVRATQDVRVAKNTVDALKRQGHDAFSEMVDIEKKGMWHRIFIGRFASENETRQYVETKKIAAVYPDFMIRQATKMAGKDSENKDNPSEKKPVPR